MDIYNSAQGVENQPRYVNVCLVYLQGLIAFNFDLNLML